MNATFVFSALAKSANHLCRNHGRLSCNFIGKRLWTNKTSTSPKNGLLLGAKPLTVRRCLQLLTLSFKSDGVTEPKCSAEYIIAHALGKKTLSGISRNQMLDVSLLRKIRYYAEQRRHKCPVQYVIGEWDFIDLVLMCSPPVFIPRPETEELVGFALKDQRLKNAHQILEIGCGSGAISIYLLTKLPELKITAIDISSEACKLTQLNAQAADVDKRLNVINTEFKSGISLDDLGLADKVDALISNPPYIPEEDMENLQPEVKMFEDHRSLNGGKDGLCVIRSILQMAAQLVKPRGCLWLEVDSSHPEMIKEIVQSTPSLNLSYIKTYKDFCNWYNVIMQISN